MEAKGKRGTHSCILREKRCTQQRRVRKKKRDASLKEKGKQGVAYSQKKGDEGSKVRPIDMDGGL